jgi:hypothetical protein
MDLKIMPDNWHMYHHPFCGTKYRGCHPTRCPKHVFEETGKWVGPKFGPTWIDQAIEDCKYMIFQLEGYREEIRQPDNILLKCPYIESRYVYNQILFWKGKQAGLEMMQEYIRRNPWWSKIPLLGKILKKWRKL